MRKGKVSILFGGIVLTFAAVVYAGTATDWITIGSGVGFNDSIAFYNSPALIWFSGDSEIYSANELLLNSGSQVFDSTNTIDLRAGEDLYANADGRIRMNAIDQFSAGSPSSVLLQHAEDDCEGPCEEFSAYYMGPTAGEGEDEMPPNLDPISIRTTRDAISMATIDSTFALHSSVRVSQDGSAKMESDIEDDEGDRGADPRSSVTCTRDGDIILQLGGAAE